MSFLAENKDAITAIGNIGLFIQSLVTMLAVIVGGGWALHRFTKERPFEANVKLRLDIGISEFDESRRVLRTTIVLENAGLAAIRLGDSRVSDHRGRLAVRAVKVKHAHGDPKPVAVLSWDASPDTVSLFDEPFVEVFQEWFPDGKSYTLEAKETAELCRDFVISKEFEIVNVLVLIYEGIVRDASLKRPYYWVLERTFDLTRAE